MANEVQNLNAFGSSIAANASVGDVDSKGSAMFQETFKRQAVEAEKTRKKYSSTMFQQVGPSKTREAERELKKSSKAIADDILRQDAKMRLNFPFNLRKNLSKIEAHRDYYLNDKIITPIGTNAACVICGKPFKSGDLVASDNVSSVMTHASEADPEIEIDGDDFSLYTIV